MRVMPVFMILLVSLIDVKIEIRVSVGVQKSE